MDKIIENKNSKYSSFHSKLFNDKSDNLLRTIRKLSSQTELTTLNKTDFHVLKKSLDRQKFYLQKSQDLNFYPTKIADLRKKENTLSICLLLTNIYS